MRVLITGGAGFIGSTLTQRLLKMEHEVVILDASPQVHRLKTGDAGPTVLCGSVLDLDVLKAVFEDHQPEVVVHMAALRNLGSQRDPYSAHQLNATGMVNVLEAARQARVDRVVYASSVAVYGSPSYYRSLGFDPNSVTEEMPPNPYNVYGVTKLYDEMMSRRYSEIYSLCTIGLRLSIVIGPGKTPGSKTSEFNDLIEAPVLGVEGRISSFGGQKVGLIYIEDAVMGFACACTAPTPRHAVFNLSSYSVSSAELEQAVLEVCPGAAIRVDADEQERKVASAVSWALAYEELGYRPRYTLVDAIREHQQRLRSQIAGGSEATHQQRLP